MVHQHHQAVMKKRETEMLFIKFIISINVYICRKLVKIGFTKKKETPENPGLLFILSRFHHRHHQTHHHQNLHSDHNQCRVWRAYLR